VRVRPDGSPRCPRLAHFARALPSDFPAGRFPIVAALDNCVRSGKWEPEPTVGTKAAGGSGDLPDPRDGDTGGNNASEGRDGRQSTAPIFSVTRRALSLEIVGRVDGALVADVPRIESGDRLQQENVGLLRCHRLVLQALWNDEEFSLVELDDAIAKVDS
jgi:hypothetical protein